MKLQENIKPKKQTKSKRIKLIISEAQFRVLSVHIPRKLSHYSAETEPPAVRLF